MTAQEVIEKFDLKPLPNEGGFFKQIYLDPHKIPTTTLGPFAKEHLPLFSVIYYLITPDSFSALHKLVGSEVWTWVAGGSLEQVIVHPSGTWEKRLVGFGKNLEPISIILPGCWQGTKLREGDFALCSVIMSPAYDEGDFTLAEASFIEKYPQLEDFLAP